MVIPFNYIMRRKEKGKEISDFGEFTLSVLGIHIFYQFVTAGTFICFAAKNSCGKNILDK
jgi:hypothetical protein